MLNSNLDRYQTQLIDNLCDLITEDSNLRNEVLTEYVQLIEFNRMHDLHDSTCSLIEDKYYA